MIDWAGSFSYFLCCHSTGPYNETCFRNFIGRFLLRYVLGYNVLIYSSLKSIMVGDSGMFICTCMHGMCVFVCVILCAFPCGCMCMFRVCFCVLCVLCSFVSICACNIIFISVLLLWVVSVHNFIICMKYPQNISSKQYRKAPQS